MPSTEEIERLRLVHEAAWKRQQQRDRVEARRFNVFGLLRRSEDELTHSNFLGTLLDVNGSHGQDALFLGTFLSHLRYRGHLPEGLKVASNDWRIIREKSTAWGRLDLVIYSRTAGVVIVIENKINATEGTDQIPRYRTWLNDQKGFALRLLIYLTLEGERSRTAQEDIRLSYRYDIVTVLSAAVVSPGLRASRVRDAITQYLEALPLEGLSMRKNTELALELAKPANIEMAFEIAEEVPRVKAALFGQLYRAVSAAWARHLGELSSEYNIWVDGYVKDWAAVAIYPSLSDQRPYAYWRLEKVAKGDCDGLLCYGIATNGRVDALIRAPHYARFVAQLENQEFDRTNVYWVRRKLTEYDTRSSSFWEAVAKDSTRVGEDLAKQVWELFQTTRAAVDELNVWAQQLPDVC